MTDALTRRQLLIGGAVLLASGCANRPSNSSSSSAAPSGEPTEREAIPAYDLGSASYALTPGSGPGMWYEVVPGDSLSGVARMSNVPIEVIAQSNRLVSAHLVRGQRLWLPGATQIGADPVASLDLPQRPLPDGDDVDTPHGHYVLVHREQWAVSAVRGNNLPMNGVSRITIHHTGEHAGLEGVPEVEVLRRIEHYHQATKGWAAIGYHYLVGTGGRVYEGRPVQYQGAHVRSNNEHNLGISVIGDFMHQLPNPRQLATVDAFLTDQRLRYKISDHRVYGHRQLGSSECPGDALYGWLETYRT